MEYFEKGFDDHIFTDCFHAPDTPLHGWHGLTYFNDYIEKYMEPIVAKNTSKGTWWDLSFSSLNHPEWGIFY